MSSSPHSDPWAQSTPSTTDPQAWPPAQEEFTTPPQYGTGDEGSTGMGESTSTGQVAKDEAANVKDTALSAGGSVASTAKDQAATVVSEAATQARGLFDQVRGEVSGQATGQLQRVAASLQSMSKELGTMASKSEQSGPVTDLAHEASRRGGEIAHWLENHEPSDVLEEVKSFARRRPVAFLAISFAAGIVAGRITRGAVAANTSLDSGDRRAPAAIEPVREDNRSIGYESQAGTLAGPTMSVGTEPGFVPPPVDAPTAYGDGVDQTVGYPPRSGEVRP